MCWLCRPENAEWIVNGGEIHFVLGIGLSANWLRMGI